MKKWLIKIIIVTLAILAAGFVLPGIEVQNVYYAVLAAVVLSALNAIVRPIFIFLTIPITIVTLGLFLLVINACIILMADYLIGDGFEVSSFWWALLFSLVVSLISSVLDKVGSKEDDRQIRN